MPLGAQRRSRWNLAVRRVCRQQSCPAKSALSFARGGERFNENRCVLGVSVSGKEDMMRGVAFFSARELLRLFQRESGKRGWELSTLTHILKLLLCIYVSTPYFFSDTQSPNDAWYLFFSRARARGDSLNRCAHANKKPVDGDISVVLVSVFRLSDAPHSWSAIYALSLGRQLSRFALRD